MTITSLTFAQKSFIDQPFVETNAKVDTLVVPDKIYISINLNEADSKNKNQSKNKKNNLKQL